MKSFSTFLIMLLTISTISAQQAHKFDKDKLDKFFAEVEKHDKGMGSISIFKDGKEVYQKSIGFADIQHGLKADKQTIYRIGSISKTFTATIILKMVDEGKLTLADTLSKYYPDVPNAKKITIEHLLRHRSGLFNFTNATDYTDWMEKPLTKKEILQKIKDNGTVFEPNEKAEYSNSNFVLLAYIAEKLERKPFKTILKEKICIPLNLASTNYGGKINYKGNEALSYNRIDDWEKATETDMSIPSGAGAVVSTPTDINTFFHALQNGKIISEASLEQMKKLVDDYGMGLFTFPFHKKTAYGHTGGIDGFSSMAGYFLEDKMSITYISNGTALPVNDIMIAALSIYYGKKYEIPEFKPAFEVKSADLDKYLGTYGSPSFPLKITISKEGAQLKGQATGQPAFPLEAFELHQFKFDAAMLKLEFLPEEKKLILNQGGLKIEMTME